MCTGRAHSAHWAPCCGVRWAMSWPPPRLYRGQARPYRCQARPCSKPGRPCRRLYRNTPITKAMRAHRVARCRACRSPPMSSRKALSAVSQPRLHCIMTQGHPSATIQRFVSRLSPWPSHALAHCRMPCAQAGRLAVSWVVSWPSRPYRGLSPMPRPTSPALCHDTNYCIVTQCKLKMGSSLAAFLHPFFFHHFFFFILFHLLEDPNIYIYIYIYIHFPVEQINLLKFIFSIFSSFTHCLTLKKNFFTSFFFYLILDHFVQNFSNNLFSY